MGPSEGYAGSSGTWLRESMFGNPSVDSLLEHVGFLRNLARSLVFDEGQAEDVVQEALVVALRNKPKNVSRTRAWLAGITRNLALKRLRTNGRRKKREQAVAKPEALASTADVVARLDLQRRVVAEVMTLGEPYRSTLVYRYFDDYPAREIAHRMSVPVKTVETRLRRGVQQLRQRMDTVHGGDRKVWVLGLAALVPAILTKEVSAAAAATGIAGTALHGVAMGTKLTAGAVAGLVATSFFVGRGLSEEGHVAAPRTAVHPSRSTAHQDLDDIMSQLQAERARRIEAERKLFLTTRVEDTQAVGNSGPRAPLRPAVGPRFLYDGFDRALRSIDWEIVASSLEQMPRLLANITDSRLNEREPPEDGSELHRFNGPFMAEVLKLRKNGIEGSTLNNVWTHPAVIVNMIHATLRKAGHPLSDPQQAQLSEIGLRYVDHDRARLAGYVESTLALQRLLDETALKDRFFTEVDAMLQEPQRNVLHPAVQRGYTNSDLFSSAIVWGSHARAVGAKSRQALVDTYVDSFARAFDVDEALVTPIVERRTAAMGDKLLDEPYTLAAKRRNMRVERVREFAELGLELRKEMLRQLPLNEEQRTKVREDSLVPVPYRLED